MPKHFAIFIVCVLTCTLPANGQDSLLRIWHDAGNPDTVRFKALSKVIWKNVSSRPDTARSYALHLLDSSRQHGNTKWEANALTAIGATHFVQGNFPAALQYYQSSLTVYQSRNDPKGIASTYSNIAGIYNQQGKFGQMLEYLQKAEKKHQEAGVTSALAQTYNNMGVAYENLGKADSAIHMYKLSEEIRIALGDSAGLAPTYNNLGVIYAKQKNYTEASFYYQKAWHLREINEDIQGMAQSANNIGSLFLDQKDFGEAVKWCEKGKQLALESESLSDQTDSYLCLCKSYQGAGDLKKALENSLLYSSAKDSLLNESKTEELTRIALQYEFNQTQLADSIEREHERLISAAKLNEKEALLEKQEIRNTALIFIAVILLGFAVFAWNRFKVTAKQKEIITVQQMRTDHQKKLIEIKNREITDSISYARKLQDAILPTNQELSSILGNHFVLYKPKDIVAGDFYFLRERNGVVYVAAADCTGHGVPGAMLSVVCSNALIRAIDEFQIREPGKLLDKVNELVENTLSGGENTVYDGMDISLLILEKSAGGKWKNARWSGANNPLVLIREKSVIELPANKQPVGRYEERKPFDTIPLDLLPGDELFLFTDGYADQFGGLKGKKLKYKAFKNTLLHCAGLEQHQKSQFLQSFLHDWQGPHEQVDDICVIGIKA